MKRVKVPAWYKGLVYKNNRYVRTLDEGAYWLWSGEELIALPMNQPFTTQHEIGMLLEDDKLKSELVILEVREGQIALQYDDGVFKGVVKPGKYGYWKGMVDYKFTIADLAKIDITEDIERTVLAKPELAAYVRCFQVEPYEQAMFYVDGVPQGKKGPGVYYFWKNPVVIQLVRSDTRTQQLEIGGQELLTKDKVAIRINFHAQYQVTDVEQAVTQNKEYEKQLYTLVQLALRAYISGYSLDELMEKRDQISEAILSSAKEKAVTLGVSLLAAGIKDIILPGDVRDIMNQVLIAEKKAQANVITRREETASTRNLLNTAKLMEENDMLFRLKELEYVERIADKINTLSVSNGGQLIDQMKELFVPRKVK